MSDAGGAELSAGMEAALAASLFAVDPAGTGGVAVRAYAGPARDLWLEALREVLPPGTPMRRIPAHAGDNRLLGGLDLAATLAAGRPVAERGLFAECDGGIALFAMAERLPVATAARLAAVLDSGAVAMERDGLGLRHAARFGVVALDEGASEDERPPAALLDRLAFLLDLTTHVTREAEAALHSPAEILAARALLPNVSADAAIIEALCGTAMALGIASIRAPLLALKVAKASAALDGRSEVSTDDASLAARYVLAPRATVVPTTQDDAQQPDPEPPPEPEPDAADAGEQQESQQDPEGKLDDIVLAAAEAAIPAGLLAQLRLALGGPARMRSPGKAGVAQHSATRGRPIGTRRGEPRGGARLDLLETLRAAAPWQPLRRRASPAAGPRIRVSREDFRVKRFQQRSETTTIFVVDASGSSALHRLAEAKGAVELLLADCYVRRDSVALLAFRGRTAELLLPPTRSLVRAKRSLAGLPGGGGTPLASGIEAALSLADSVRRKGGTPVVILLTDGRANVARDGTGGRAQAGDDALAAARAVRAAALTVLLVDTSAQPQAIARDLAMQMGAMYLALPQADARSLSSAIRASVSAAPASR